MGIMDYEIFTKDLWYFQHDLLLEGDAQFGFRENTNFMN